MALYCGNHAEHINTLYRNNEQFVSVRTGGTPAILVITLYTVQ